MSIWQKLFGGRGPDAYHEGIALYEQGRHGEAVERLREVCRHEPDTPRGSLAAFYFRQSLVGEARRLLRADDPDAAAAVLREAVAAWPDFPDLHFLLGAAAALAGDWDAARSAAREALRRNADYCEARLLEASALQALGRPREAAASLTSLLESGRRVRHRLIDELTQPGGYTAANLPDDLPARVRRAAAGDAFKERIATAVSLCQAGDWEAGIERFAALAAEQPTFPDIRARHAAALFQVGRLDAALGEVEAALSLNDGYRTAVCLKGLILADRGEIAPARSFLAAAVPRSRGAAGRHEEIFLAYLRAVLAFLLGELDECRQMLAGWDDLAHHFARAALLLAACDAADGRGDAAQQRLEELRAAWPADADLALFQAALLVAARRWDACESALVRWPAGKTDLRPLLLRARLQVARGETPEVPDPLPTEPAAAAWRLLLAHRALAQDEAAVARDVCHELFAAGTADEETGALWLRAAARAGVDREMDLPPRPPLPDAWVPPLCHLRRRQGRDREVEAMLAALREVRPDRADWWWLGAGFWLEPIRRWLG